MATKREATRQAAQSWAQGQKDEVLRHHLERIIQAIGAEANYDWLDYAVLTEIAWRWHKVKQEQLA